MTTRDHVLLLLSIAVQHDEIAKAELVRLLRIIADNPSPARFVELDAIWRARVGHLIQEGG